MGLVTFDDIGGLVGCAVLYYMGRAEVAEHTMHELHWELWYPATNNLGGVDQKIRRQWTTCWCNPSITKSYMYAYMAMPLFITLNIMEFTPQDCPADDPRKRSHRLQYCPSGTIIRWTLLSGPRKSYGTGRSEVAFILRLWCPEFGLRKSNMFDERLHATPPNGPTFSCQLSVKFNQNNDEAVIMLRKIISLITVNISFSKLGYVI